MVGIVNYGMGNIRSVSNALTFIGTKHMIIENKTDFDKVHKIILPGVGAFGQAMINLESSRLIDSLNEHVLNMKKPILGLCLGMQLLLDNSTEHGLHKGLGYIKGSVLSLKDKIDNLPIPHMGWNDIKIEKKSSLFNENSQLDFYFVHSFYCNCIHRDNIIATVDYGVKMDVIIQKDNIFGCQFHPEKSQRNGLNLLSNFCSING